MATDTYQYHMRTYVYDFRVVSTLLKASGHLRLSAIPRQNILDTYNYLVSSPSMHYCALSDS